MFDAALEYARRHQLHALLVMQRKNLVCEEYDGGYADKPHALYSGTKSFWGVVAVAAQEDGLLALDEPVAQTIERWRKDSMRLRITLRDLLSLTSGLPFGGLGNAVPSFERSLQTDIRDTPGSKFTYSGTPFQVFGAVLQRKLATRGLSPHDYLRERILEPIGLQISRWRTLSDGTQMLPTGAFLIAREWLKFGQLIAQSGRWNDMPILRAESLAACFEGSVVNPMYGLGFWLRPVAHPVDIVYASGSGGQALYIIPSLEIVAVHFGNSKSYRHETFVKRLLQGLAPA